MAFRIHLQQKTMTEHKPIAESGHFQIMEKYNPEWQAARTDDWKTSS
jgi:hypothetical protein